MANSISSANVSFNFLKGNSDFLNLVLNNICNAVLLLDNKMNLIAFNDTMKTLFVNAENEYLLYKKCGNAIGCAHAVKEEAECTKTSRCNFCDIREAVLISYSENKPVYRDMFSREFFNINNVKVLKYLNFSTRLFKFNKDNYIILIIEDITETIKLKEKIKKLK
ncbi:MAG: hypothetical protein Kow0068_17330 [Marinilabiliales bacterium]